MELQAAGEGLRMSGRPKRLRCLKPQAATTGDSCRALAGASRFMEVQATSEVVRGSGRPSCPKPPTATARDSRRGAPSAERLPTRPGQSRLLGQRSLANRTGGGEALPSTCSARRPRRPGCLKSQAAATRIARGKAPSGNWSSKQPGLPGRLRPRTESLKAAGEERPRLADCGAAVDETSSSSQSSARGRTPPST